MDVLFHKYPDVPGSNLLISLLKEYISVLLYKHCNLFALPESSIPDKVPASCHLFWKLLLVLSFLPVITYRRISIAPDKKDFACCE